SVSSTDLSPSSRRGFRTRAGIRGSTYHSFMNCTTNTSGATRSSWLDGTPLPFQLAITDSSSLTRRASSALSSRSVALISSSTLVSVIGGLVRGSGPQPAQQVREFGVGRAERLFEMHVHLLGDRIRQAGEPVHSNIVGRLGQMVEADEPPYASPLAAGLAHGVEIGLLAWALFGVQARGVYQRPLGVAFRLERPPGLGQHGEDSLVPAVDVPDLGRFARPEIGPGLLHQPREYAER